MKNLYIALLIPALLFAAACTPAAEEPQKPKVTAPEAAAIKALRSNSMFEESALADAATYSEEQPFGSQRLPRAFKEAVPQIPHSIEGLSITAESNECLGCHEQGKGYGAPEVPASHMDGKQLSNARFLCNLCHVPQSNAKPLVKNENDKLAIPAVKPKVETE